MVCYSLGFICVLMMNEIVDWFELLLMVVYNEDLCGIVYMVFVDVVDCFSIGISVFDWVYML